MRWQQGIIQLRPNMVNYLEDTEQGLTYHYATNKPWTLYLGNLILYRKTERMAVVEKAWERKLETFLNLRIQLDAYMVSRRNKGIDLVLNGQTVHLRTAEVIYLRQEIESLVRVMKAEDKLKKEQALKSMPVVLKSTTD